MASKFVLALNSLRIQMICSKEKMNLLCTWNIFNKDPELKAFLEFWDNHEKAAALLQPLAANDDFHGLHVESLGLNVCFTLLNEMKAQFEELKTKMDSIVSWTIAKTFGDNELETFPDLLCHNKIVPAPVPLPLTNQIISKYVQEFNKLKSKVESLKIKLNLICGSIINKKVEHLVHLQSGSVHNFIGSENEFDSQGSGSELSFSDDEDDMDVERAHRIGIEIGSLSLINEEDSDSNGKSTHDDDNESIGSKSCKTKSTLKSPTSKNVQCEVCNKKFKYPCLLKNHLLVHSEQRNHECVICEKRFARASDMKKHEKVHTGEKNYSCNICQKSFAHLYYLKIHKRIHTKEKPYNCNQCELKFANLGNLKSHQLTHTGEKPHPCIFCGNDFRHRSALIDHLRIHTGEKPFKCSACNQQFRHKSSLRSHQKKHHPIE